MACCQRLATNGNDYSYRLTVSRGSDFGGNFHTRRDRGVVNDYGTLALGWPSINLTIRPNKGQDSLAYIQNVPN
jgi:hypothetical protein